MDQSASATAPEDHDAGEVTIDVKALRERLGWTQAQLAEYLRLDRSRVSRLENGGRIRGSAGKLLEQLAEQHPDPVTAKPVDIPRPQAAEPAA